MGAVVNAVNHGETCLPVEAENILQSLASTWADVTDSNNLQVIPLKGAMTNEVFEIKWPTKKEEPQTRRVILRIYGEGVGMFFNRNDEMRTFEFMSKYGNGPRLLDQFSNGRIEEFIHARTLSATDMCNPDVSILIAVKLKEFHGLNVPGPKNVLLWNRLRKWLAVAKSLSSLEEAMALCLDAIEEDISLLEKELSGNHQCIAFCHNDLQYGNIMMDEETRSITIIDYEYASYNPIAYDIANHFCEWAANYHTETPHVMDNNKYPSLEVRQRFLRAYMSHTDDEPRDLEVERLLQQVEKYSLASHLLWGLWGIISEHVNEIDFDYMEYARQRLQLYWSKKPLLLVGKVSMEWLVGEKTKVLGTYPPRIRPLTGYVEKDTAGQTNIYSVEPPVYVAESAISSGTAGSSAEGSENTAAIAGGLALIFIAATSSILLQVGKNPPQVQTAGYSGPSLSYYINKFKPQEIVQALPPATSETSISLVPEASAPAISQAQIESETQPEASTSVIDVAS